MRFHQASVRQILKFMSEHITALNLVLNEVQPKFSSLLRRVSKILKFVLRYKFIKKGDNGGLNFALYARNNVADTKSVTYPSFLNH